LKGLSWIYALSAPATEKCQISGPGLRKIMPTEKAIVTRKPRRDALDKLEDEIIPDYAGIIEESKGVARFNDRRTGFKIMEKSTLLRKIEREELMRKIQ